VSAVVSAVVTALFASVKASAASKAGQATHGPDKSDDTTQDSSFMVAVSERAVSLGGKVVRL
jgi:hypothetical protein